MVTASILPHRPANQADITADSIARPVREGPVADLPQMDHFGCPASGRIDDHGLRSARTASTVECAELNASARTHPANRRRHATPGPKLHARKFSPVGARKAKPELHSPSVAEEETAIILRPLIRIESGDVGADRAGIRIQIHRIDYRVARPLLAEAECKRQAR